MMPGDNLAFPYAGTGFDLSLFGEFPKKDCSLVFIKRGANDNNCLKGKSSQSLFAYLEAELCLSTYSGRNH